MLADRFPSSLPSTAWSPKRNDTHRPCGGHVERKPHITEQMPKPSGEGMRSISGVNEIILSKPTGAGTNCTKVAWQLAGLSGKELVYDLYTGTGTIANFLAADAKKS